MNLVLTMNIKFSTGGLPVKVLAVYFRLKLYFIVLIVCLWINNGKIG